jgi:excisionase family DNA binding protein
MPTDAPLRPAYCTIAQWCQLSGIGRSTTYELLASGDLTAKKLGARVLIDVEHGLAFIRNLPDAKIGQ